jgi:hypothetical protein
MPFARSGPLLMSATTAEAVEMFPAIAPPRRRARIKSEKDPAQTQTP